MKNNNVIHGVLLLLFFASFPWVLGQMSHDDDTSVPPIIDAAPFNLPSLPSAQLINEPLQPVRKPRNLNDDKVALGRRLFLDKRLSPRGDISCDSCHRLNESGVDHRSHALGGDPSRGSINTPAIYNSANNFRWYWDGRAVTLEAQVDESLTSLTEMGADWLELLETLASIAEYQAMFTQIYPEKGVSKESVIDALVVFERSLITIDAPFDRYLLGEENALTPEQQNGYQLFKSYGCSACHQGGNIGGNMFQLFGVMGDYFADRNPIYEVDMGRFNVTGKDDDRHRFRVPSLRNVALTAPYFHDGSVATLEQAVMVMASYQLGRPIPIDDARLIVAFLHSLSGPGMGGER